MISVFAPAKVNLALHITGQRSDGYHLLDSLVVLLDCGDHIRISPNDGYKFTADGPFAGDIPIDDTNLVCRAARWLAGRLNMPLDLHINLTKNLPPASGIGGGSSDAAAALRGLCKHWQCDMPADHELATLGADIPVCLRRGTVRMQGIGEIITDVDYTLKAWVVLVNPRVGVSTPTVFRALQTKENPPLDLDDLANTGIRHLRNDLERPAVQALPVIADVIDIIASQAGVDVVRMSGSGATCFGLFNDHSAALMAADYIRKHHPNWWVDIARPI